MSSNWAWEEEHQRAKYQANHKRWQALTRELDVLAGKHRPPWVPPHYLPAVARALLATSFYGGLAAVALWMFVRGLYGFAIMAVVAMVGAELRPGAR